MTALRALLRDYRTLALLLLGCALLVKAIVPQGYMVGGADRQISVQLCLDGITHKSVTVSIPGKGSEKDKPAANEHCAFTSLSMTALGGADAPLLALALAFILATGFAPLYRVLHGATGQIRPPLRGPPLTA
ncbi:MAG: hypothetical protein LKF30_05345 [Sphingobium sp.]|nr:hypothetical protein [Sphingobium sp.]MCI1272033.1 hypothetical protein [Sphingobium sp.]MCI1757095.1 hypothetical protein [Sphingobium sp.]MCI2052792.1 hypothetical protein [Sphingobium sp.]